VDFEVDVDLGYTLEHDMLSKLWVLKTDITRTTPSLAVHYIPKTNLTRETLLAAVHNILETHLTPKAPHLTAQNPVFDNFLP
jgi:hypothetical protein